MDEGGYEAVYYDEAVPLPLPPKAGKPMAITRKCCSSFLQSRHAAITSDIIIADVHQMSPPPPPTLLKSLYIMRREPNSHGMMQQWRDAMRHESLCMQLQHFA